MKISKSIIVCFLSLLLVYVGGGVSWVEFCRSGCEQIAEVKTSCCCCTADDSGHCHDGELECDCCDSTVLTLDLMKTSGDESRLIIPEVLHTDIPLFLYFVSSEKEEVTRLLLYEPPPSPDTSRYYLSLFSILLI